MKRKRPLDQISPSCDLDERGDPVQPRHGRMTVNGGYPRAHVLKRARKLTKAFALLGKLVDEGKVKSVKRR